MLNALACLSVRDSYWIATTRVTEARELPMIVHCIVTSFPKVVSTNISPKPVVVSEISINQNSFT